VKYPGERFSKLHPSCLTPLVAKRLHGFALSTATFGHQIAPREHPAEEALNELLD
jgi:hypothetical protein